MPSTEVSAASVKENPLIIDLLITCGITKSRGEGRRLIKDRGLSVDGEKVTEEFAEVTEEQIAKGEVLIKKGKKVFHKAIIK